MSEDLSSESETWRANTPAWHTVLTAFTVAFSERATPGGFGGALGGGNGVIFMLDLLVLLVP